MPKVVDPKCAKTGKRMMVNLESEQWEWLRTQAFKQETSISSLVRLYVMEQIEASRKQAQQA